MEIFFVDDTWVVMPKHRITPFFQLINERFISFIMETESDNCTFAFFGFLVSRKEDFGFSTDAYPELKV